MPAYPTGQGFSNSPTGPPLAHESADADTSPEAGAAIVNGKVYVVGGFSGSALGTTEEYDPDTDAWTPRASMPTARRSPVVAAVNDKVYAIGGMSYIDVNQVTDSYATEEYDLAAGDAVTEAYARSTGPLPPDVCSPTHVAVVEDPPVSSHTGGGAVATARAPRLSPPGSAGPVEGYRASR